MNDTTLSMRPHERTALEALCEQTQPIAIPPQQLHSIPAPAAKDEQLTREWIFGQLQLHDRRQAIKALALMQGTA